MDRYEAIRALKARIKDLAATQKKEKASRKGCGADKMPSLWVAIYCRGAEITACLNFYLALREKKYRHGTPDEYWDKRFTKALSEKFGGVSAKV
jgi:hypothetical protein